MKTFKLRVLRFNPLKGSFFQEYEVPLRKYMTVLDALIYVKKNIDPTLSFRYACKAGLCGSCGMVINGKESLACETQIESELEKGKITIEPLNNFPVIRDLIVDYTPLFTKHASIKPYIIRKEEKMDREYLQTPEELDKFIMVASCINCGLCYSSCPITSTDRAFLGPYALAQSYRYVMDTRDEGFNERLEIINSAHGVWRCHFAGSCSDVCPKGVDPAYTIQQLKGFILFRKNEIRRRRIAPLKKEKRSFKNARDSEGGPNI